MRARVIAILAGIVGGVVIATQTRSGYSVQTSGDQIFKYVVAVGIIAAGVWLLKTGPSTISQLGGYVLAAGGASFILGKLLVPDLPQPPGYQPPQAASYGSLHPRPGGPAPVTGEQTA